MLVFVTTFANNVLVGKKYRICNILSPTRYDRNVIAVWSGLRIISETRLTPSVASFNHVSNNLQLHPSIVYTIYYTCLNTNSSLKECNFDLYIKKKNLDLFINAQLRPFDLKMCNLDDIFFLYHKHPVSKDFWKFSL